jgi:hypothetical protein
MSEREQRTEKKRIYLKIRPKGLGPWAFMEPDELMGMIDPVDDADSIYEMAVVRMTESEFEALPEFQGW